MTTTMIAGVEVSIDTAPILQERKRLMRIIDEGTTASEQIKLYNRLIVLKTGNKTLPGLTEEVQGNADGAETSGDLAPGVCPFCVSYKVRKGSQPSVNGIIRHVNSMHPGTSDDILDELRRINGGASARGPAVEARPGGVRCKVVGCSHIFTSPFGVTNHLRMAHKQLSEPKRARLAEQIREELVSA